MIKKEIQTKLLNAYMSNDRDGINQIYVQLINERSKMDRWFSRYLDLFNDKLVESKRDDPHKRLYNAKFSEYSELNTLLRTAEHYMKRA